MRKLTVKNFSVIKDAELEFGKITVLIGPQSSGKSLLFKLAYFFQKVIVEVAESSIRDGRDKDVFVSRVADEFSTSWFPAFGSESNASAKYIDGNYQVCISRTGESGLSKVDVQFAPEILKCYERTWKDLGESREFKLFANQIGAMLKGMQSSDSDIYSYVPSMRSFFVTAQKAVLASSNRTDPIAVRFSQDFSYDFERRVPPFPASIDLTTWINAESRKIMKGEVVVSPGGSETFLANDGRQLPVSFLSSGTQELLPLFTCLREFVALCSVVAHRFEFQKATHKRLFLIEEPESNIFPSAQYELVRIFARMTNEPTLDVSWAITTHSPYIMTAFNTLLEAGRVGAKPGNREKVNAVIPEQYWIQESDFKAYAIKDGNLESIFKPEAKDPDGEGMINGDYLDSVSDQLGKEFNRLLDIEFAE